MFISQALEKQPTVLQKHSEQVIDKMTKKGMFMKKGYMS